MKLLLLIGVIFFFGSISLLKTSIENLRTENEGVIVEVRINALPSSCIGTRIKHFATFFYNGKRYIKRIPAGYCDHHHVGEFVRMRYLNDESELLFPNESRKIEVFANVVICMACLGVIICAIVKR